MAQQIAFSKISGSGNDFLVIDNRDGLIDATDAVDFVRSVCRRAISVGGDGVILIENDPAGEVDFAWHYFNSDGSEAEMCGNGGRCAARFAYEKGIAGKKMAFRTIAGIIRAEITGDRRVKIQMTPPADYRDNVTLRIHDEWMDLKYIDSGVPHVVVEVPEVEEVEVAQVGRQLRYHQEFAPRGTNVNFVEVTGPDTMSIRTYERGVEGETLACGTGCVASAITMALQGRVISPVTLTTRSGDKLSVHFRQDGRVPTEVFFEGDVRWNYDGVLREDALLP